MNPKLVYAIKVIVMLFSIAFFSLWAGLLVFLLWGV
jgi:hypothetical protein